MTHGLQWDFNYTFSKSLDIGSNAERINQFDAFYQADQIINSWSPAQLRGVSDFDTTHQFNTNWVYELPFGRGKSFASTSSRLVERNCWRLAVVRSGALDQRLPHHHRDLHLVSHKLVTALSRNTERSQTKDRRSLSTKTAIRIYSKTRAQPRATFATPTPVSPDSATSFADQATSASTRPEQAVADYANPRT